MARRRIVAALALALLTLGAAPADRPRPAEMGGTPPSFLVILADDVGWRDVDPSVPTPTLDRLRSEGVTFTRAFVNPVCSPSRYTLLFGRYSGRSGMGDVVLPAGRRPEEENPPAPLSLVSLPEVLRASGKGYTSAAFGKWHLSNAHQGAPVVESPRLHGFDRFLAGNLFGVQGDYYSWPRIDDGVESTETEYSTDAILDAAAAWWTATKGPKLAWIATNVAHLPVHVPPAHLLPPGYEVDEQSSPRRKFEASIVALDTKMEGLLDSIDLTATYVIYLSDNGTPQTTIAPDQRRHRVKASVYDGGVNVPLVVAGPLVPLGSRGKECAALVQGTDFLATLSELAGIDALEMFPRGYDHDSVSFAACLVDPSSPGARRSIYCEYWMPNGPGGLPRRDLDRRRLTRRVGPGTFTLLYTDGELLFHDDTFDPTHDFPLQPRSLDPATREVFRTMKADLREMAALED